jgi:TPR repeat protein
MAEALRWGHRAADQGHAEAMDFIGFLYFRGVEVPRNPDVAAGYFKAAAGQSAQAAWNLGQCHFAAQGGAAGYSEGAGALAAGRPRGGMAAQRRWRR